MARGDSSNISGEGVGLRHRLLSINPRRKHTIRPHPHNDQVGSRGRGPGTARHAFVHTALRAPSSLVTLQTSTHPSRPAAEGRGAPCHLPQTSLFRHSCGRHSPLVPSPPSCLGALSKATQPKHRPSRKLGPAQPSTKAGQESPGKCPATCPLKGKFRGVFCTVLQRAPAGLSPHRPTQDQPAQMLTLKLGSPPPLCHLPLPAIQDCLPLKTTTLENLSEPKTGHTPDAPLLDWPRD